MATTADCTTPALLDPALPLAHRANTDAPGHWSARVAALEALRDAYRAEGYSLDTAAELAIRTLDDRLEAEAALLSTRAASKRLGLLMVADPGRARRAAALMAEGYSVARALRVITIADGLHTDAERQAA
jgi:hypothetical protein